MESSSQKDESAIKMKTIIRKCYFCGHHAYEWFECPYNQSKANPIKLNLKDTTTAISTSTDSTEKTIVGGKK